MCNPNMTKLINDKRLVVPWMRATRVTLHGVVGVQRGGHEHILHQVVGHNAQVSGQVPADHDPAKAQAAQFVC